MREGEIMKRDNEREREGEIMREIVKEKHETQRKNQYEILFVFQYLCFPQDIIRIYTG